MKQALISPSELKESGYRVAQVVEQGQTFDVGGCFWVDCTDNVVADQFWYDPSDELIKANPVVVTEDLIASPPPEDILNVTQTVS